jgi:hypothetical protein
MARERVGSPSETLMGLRRRLAALPRRDLGRRAQVLSSVIVSRYRMSGVSRKRRRAVG